MSHFVIARATQWAAWAGIEIGLVENARFARLAGASCVLYVASSVLGLLLNIILARSLGPAGLGVYAAAFALITFLLVITNAGAPAVVLRYIPTYLKHGDARSARACAAWGFCHVTGAAVIGGCIFAVVVTMTAWLEPSARPTYLAAAAVLPLWAILALQSSVLQGHERVIQARIPDLVVRPTVLIVLFIGCRLLFESGANAPHIVMLLQAVAFLAAIVINVRLLLRLVPVRPAQSVRPRRQEVGAWYGMATVLTTTQIAGAALAQSALLILPYHAGPAELGLLRVALAASALVGLPATAVMMALPPIIARLHAARQLAELQALLTVSARMLVLLSLPVAALFAIAGRTVLQILFGADFTGAFPLLLILTGGQIAMVISGSASWVLRMTGHERFEARATVAAAVCQVAALFALIPFFGAAGAAAAQAGGMVLLSALLIGSALRRGELDPTFFGRSITIHKSKDVQEVT